MRDTIQRLEDLLSIAENKEIKLLIKILIAYIKKQDSEAIGFNSGGKK